LLKKKTLGVPFVFLITDGAVKDEREICKWTQENSKNTRILTFGIGRFCNWYFLKMLSQIGRGFNENVLFQENIQDKITALINMAAVPVLTNITMEMAGVTKCDIYPFPIPDLFAGAPLAVAGKYVASPRFPDQVLLKGFLSDGRQIAIDVLSTANLLIPVNKVFLKQRIDLLTSRAWLEESKELEEEVTKLSVEESMPSRYTTMVAYEVDQKQKEKEQKEKKKKTKKVERRILPSM